MTTPKNSTHCCVCSAKFTFKAPHPDDIDEQTIKYLGGWGFAVHPESPNPLAVCGPCLREFVHPLGLILERALWRARAGREDG